MFATPQRNSRFLAFFLAVLTCLSLSPNEVAAAPSDGTCDLTTNLDPDLEWEVASLSDLQVLETDAADCSSETIYQTANIDLALLSSEISDWYGTFDGNGFEFFDGDPDTQPALFDDPDGPLVITNVIRHGDTQTAGLVSYSTQNLTITNSYTTGNTTGNTTGSVDVGGLSGYTLGDVTITNSYTTGNTTGNVNVGGLSGSAFGDVTITNSYTTGNTTGDVEVGGLSGSAFDDVTITNSYTTGNTTGDINVGGFSGSTFGDDTITSSFCLDSSPNCGPGGTAGVPASAVDLQSEGFLTSWDFSAVWCFRSSLNNGYPVLRSINFGPGDTNNCRSARRRPSRSVTFDPAGGSCADHTTNWTVRFRSSYTLPTDCTRVGHVFLGWTRDPALTAPENLITTISRSGTVTAVWGEFPTAPSTVNLLANFLCQQNCDSALIAWPTSSSPTDTAVITLDGNETSCSASGETSGLKWCWITGLTPKSTHTTSVAWRNQYGTGPNTEAVFTLN